MSFPYLQFLRKLYRKCCSNGSKYSLTRTDSGYERSFLLYNFVNWMINKQGFGKASQFYRVFFGIHKELCEYYKDDHDSRCRIKHSNETELSPRYKCNWGSLHLFIFDIWQQLRSMVFCLRWPFVMTIYWKQLK